jgi:hypothetical protein
MKQENSRFKHLNRCLKSLKKTKITRTDQIVTQQAYISITINTRDTQRDDT